MWQTCPEQQGSHHSSALLACQLDAESHMADCLLFEKEDDFCMTFLVSHWLANPRFIGQITYKFNGKWFFYKKQNTLSNSLEVYHLQVTFIKESIGILSPKNQKTISIDKIHILS